MSIGLVSGKWACLLVEIIHAEGTDGNIWQPFLFTVPWMHRRQVRSASVAMTQGKRGI